MLKKSRLKPWQKKQWCIGQLDGQYLASMEDVLDLYQRPAQPGAVRLCLDERPCQLPCASTSGPASCWMRCWWPCPCRKAGRCARTTSINERGPVRSSWSMMWTAGLRYGKVSERRTKADYAAFVDQVLKQHYGQAQKKELVQDNLNTHRYGSFYEHLPLERAAQLRKLIYFHYTPRHGSWLNIVEIEFSALARQCLNRRIATMEQLEKEMMPWIEERNEKQVKIHWSFTVKEAREKMASQYAKVFKYQVD